MTFFAYFGVFSAFYPDASFDPKQAQFLSVLTPKQSCALEITVPLLTNGKQNGEAAAGRKKYFFGKYKY